jgi:uncharacterized HAD superfamily protein
MLKVSFDFDCTLGEDIIQKVAKSFLANPDLYTVYIVTARNQGAAYNRDLYGVAERLKIPLTNIFFTEGAWKYKKIQELNIDIHFDDVPEECHHITKNTACLALLLWDEYCPQSIKADNFGDGTY